MAYLDNVLRQSKTLADALGFQEAQLVGPAAALVFGHGRVGQQTAAGAIDQGLEGLVSTRLLDGGGDVIGDHGKDPLEVELAALRFGLGLQFGTQRRETRRRAPSISRVKISLLG